MTPKTERRLYQRFPVVDGLIEPITLQIEAASEAPAPPKSQPAILTNLSAGGMSVLMFAEPPKARRFEMVLSLPGLASLPVEGQVVRIIEKGQTFNIGIAFTRISKKHQAQISSMAQDHADCETRISLSLPEVCVKTCSFHSICGKPHKAPYWPK